MKDYSSFLTREQRRKLSKLNLARVIENYTPLRKNMGGYTKSGECPFHVDNTCSLRVYQEEGNPHYHCFSCKAHGDVVEFIKKIEGLEVWQACYKALTFFEDENSPVDEDDRF
ncbi:MAG: hypothetical protein HYT94_02080 [Parcubacteria group bacterium]|nr:hypothetical protein [Parcubacteria group bacterium]